MTLVNVLIHSAGLDEHEANYYFSLLSNPGFYDTTPESVSDITSELLVNGINFSDKAPSKSELLYPSNVLGSATIMLWSLPTSILPDEIEQEFFSCTGNSSAKKLWRFNIAQAQTIPA
jgi:hypothetical protein